MPDFRKIKDIELLSGVVAIPVSVPSTHKREIQIGLQLQGDAFGVIQSKGTARVNIQPFDRWKVVSDLGGEYSSDLMAMIDGAEDSYVESFEENVSDIRFEYGVLLIHPEKWDALNPHAIMAYFVVNHEYSSESSLLFWVETRESNVNQGFIRDKQVIFSSLTD